MQAFPDAAVRRDVSTVGYSSPGPLPPLIQPNPNPNPNPVEDQGQTNALPCPSALDSAAAAGLGRASSQMTSQWKPTTTAIDQYPQDAAVDTSVAHTFLH